jgi:LacI family transcriptional regulator
MASAERVATLRDVAEHAGVHVATASRALNESQSHLVTESTRLRVLEAAESLGYRANALARSLRRGRTGTLGVVVADFANPFIVTLLRGIEQETRSHDLLPLVAETRDDPAALRSAIKRLLDNRVDAIVLTAAHLTDEAYVAQIAAQVPVVLAVRGFDIGQADGGPEVRFQVMQDDYRGACSAVQHLLDLGHRRIAQLPGSEQISSFVNRGRGFVDAIASQPGAADLSTGSHASASTVAEGRRLTEELLRRPPEERPTAIFAHNDLMAVGALDALQASDLSCPADVSVVGYNDAPLVDHMDPPLTTVKLPALEIGRRSARLVIDAVAGITPAAPHSMILPEYIERGSTGPDM